MSNSQSLFNAILTGDVRSAKALTQEALGAGVAPQSLLDEQMVPAMDEVGRRFESHEYFVPELLLAARAMKGALEFIRPLLAESGVKATAKVAIGTVKGDLHDIGKNLVMAMLEGGGFEVVDLGVDVPIEKFVDAVKEKGVNIVAMSALLTTTMPSMKAAVQAFTDAGIRDQVKIMIGGAPVTEDFANQIGADGFSDNASGAVRLARSLVA